MVRRPIQQLEEIWSRRYEERRLGVGIELRQFIRFRQQGNGTGKYTCPQRAGCSGVIDKLR